MATVDELWQRGDLRAATDASAAALEARLQPFRDDGTGDLELAQALHDHGTRCWYVARYDEAERCLDRAYDLRQTLLGDTHLDTLATFERLAGLASYQLRNDLAEDRYEELVERLRGLEGNKGMRLAIARRNYAAFLRTAGRLRDARELMDQAKKIVRRGAPLEVLALHKADALLHCMQREHREAFDLVEAALRDAPLPPSHPHMATAKLIAVRSLMMVESFAEALLLADEILPQLEEGYGEHPMVAIALHVRTRLYVELSRRDEAIVDLTRALAISERVYPGSPQTHQWNAQLLALRSP